MTDSSPALQTNLGEALIKQTIYAKQRLARQLEWQITALTPDPLLSLLDYCSKNYIWSDEERAQIRRIGIVLEGIRELRQALAISSAPLINTYSKRSSSAP